MGEYATKKRENWSSRFGFIMAATGVAVGIGNIQRFPYLVGENGGAAFVVAYLIIMVFCTIPLAMMEIGMGQKTGKGIIGTYIEGIGNKTAGSVVGGYISIIPLLLNMYYLVVIAYVIYYIWASLTGVWVGADTQEVYNSICSNKAVLLVFFLIACLVTTLIVFRGITAGIDKACKVMIPIVFLTLFVVLVRGMTLEGFGKGLEFYMNPDWSKLGDWKVWLAAAGQSLFSIGVGPGMMIVYGSHLKKKDDVTLNSVTICFLDTAVALLAGFAIVPATIALGFSPASGPSLIFVVLPALFDKIAGGRILAVLFFIGVAFAGISSSISHLETPVTSFMDHFNLDRKKTVIICSIVECVGGALCVFYDEIYALVSTYAGDYFYGLSFLISVVVFAWIFGSKKVRENFNIYSDIKMGSSFDLMLKVVVTPILALVVLDLFI